MDQTTDQIGGEKIDPNRKGKTVKPRKKRIATESGCNASCTAGQPVAGPGLVNDTLMHFCIQMNVAREITAECGDVDDLPQFKVTSKKPIVSMLEAIDLINNQKYTFYKCDLCRRIFNGVGLMAAHQTSHLYMVSAFNCEICGASYHDFNLLKCHETTHFDFAATGADGVPFAQTNATTNSVIQIPKALLKRPSATGPNDETVYTPINRPVEQLKNGGKEKVKKVIQSKKRVNRSLPSGIAKKMAKDVKAWNQGVSTESETVTSGINEQIVENGNNQSAEKVKVEKMPKKSVFSKKLDGNRSIVKKPRKLAGQKVAEKVSGLNLNLDSVKPLRCLSCNSLINLEEANAISSQNGSSTLCSTCNKTGKETAKFVQEKPFVSQLSSAQPTCRICQIGFGSFISLNEHFENDHPEDEMFPSKYQNDSPENGQSQVK